MVCIPSMSTNKKMLYLRNTNHHSDAGHPGSVLPVPAVLHDRQLLRPCGRGCLLQHARCSRRPGVWIPTRRSSLSVSTASNGWPTPLWCPPARCWATSYSPVWPVMPCQAEVQGQKLPVQPDSDRHDDPVPVTQVPLYILIVNKFHLSNSYAALVLPGLVTSYNIFLTKQFFSSIPTRCWRAPSWTAAASPRSLPISCCPCPRPFWRCCPSTPSFPAGNNFFWPFLVTSKEAMYTIQVGLKQFKFANTTLFGPMMAGATNLRSAMFILFLLPAEVLPRGRYGSVLSRADTMIRNAVRRTTLPCWPCGRQTRPGRGMASRPDAEVDRLLFRTRIFPMNIPS